MQKTDRKLLNLVQMALLAAVSVVLVYAVRFPIFPAASFLEYEPGDITLIMGAFLYGPFAGLALTGVVCIVQGLTVSAASGIVGIVMHFLATGSFVVVAGLIYRWKKTLAGSIAASVAGIIVMVSTMALWNLIFTPIFMGAPRQAVIDMMLPVIIPFNLIKAGVNSVIAFILFKSVGRFLVRE